MKSVAKLFIMLNQLLLIIMAIVLPLIVFIIAMVNPRLIGLEGQAAIWSVLVGLVIWEALVIISFGLLAIAIENYHNLKIIAQNVSHENERPSAPLDGLNKTPQTSKRIEPKLTASKIDETGE